MNRHVIYFWKSLYTHERIGVAKKENRSYYIIKIFGGLVSLASWIKVHTGFLHPELENGCFRGNLLTVLSDLVKEFWARPPPKKKSLDVMVF